ncbi:hypothetical protein EJK48_0664 [Moraxella catarrhalis]|nr:hypothetical protein [Moraxella catarrhalis]AZQ94907.1 hypothetical protein EJK48_0664 [Moraxella catarrhalis]RUO14719.1 hypothetical protein EJK49_1865 [Moraxella catarrhalis]
MSNRADMGQMGCHRHHTAGGEAHLPISMAINGGLKQVMGFHFGA